MSSDQCILKTAPGNESVVHGSWFKQKRLWLRSVASSTLVTGAVVGECEALWSQNTGNYEPWHFSVTSLQTRRWPTSKQSHQVCRSQAWPDTVLSFRWLEVGQAQPGILRSQVKYESQGNRKAFKGLKVVAADFGSGHRKSVFLQSRLSWPGQTV